MTDEEQLPPGLLTREELEAILEKPRQKKRRRRPTEAEVRQMRERFAAECDLTVQELANENNLSATTVYNLLSGRTRTKAGGPLATFPASGTTSAKLTPEIVKEIREHFATNPNMALQTLAEQYGVSRSAIFNLLTGRSWAKVGGPIVTQLPSPPPHTTRLSAPKAKEIRQRYADDVSLTSTRLANQYGVTSDTICNVLRGRSWVKAGGPIFEQLRTQMVEAVIRDEHSSHH